MRYSEYHIDGWLTDYECTTDLDAINDVLALARAIKGYTGPGFVTAEVAGILSDPKAKYLPNDRWTSVIPEEDWPAMRDYITAGPAS